MLIEMTIKGLVVDSFSSTPIVILKDKAGDKVLSIWVGIYEANAIAQQIENVTMPRPMTHDLLRNLINDLGGRVDRVVVTDLRENTFFATIHLTVKGEQVAVDARPSDAIALALRSRSPILVDEQVIEAAKTGDFALERVDNDRLQKWLESLDPDELGKYRMYCARCRPRECRPADKEEPGFSRSSRSMLSLDPLSLPCSAPSCSRCRARRDDPCSSRRDRDSGRALDRVESSEVTCRMP
jgi:bifunctional DNase/RNase